MRTLAASVLVSVTVGLLPSVATPAGADDGAGPSSPYIAEVDASGREQVTAPTPPPTQAPPPAPAQVPAPPAQEQAPLADSSVPAGQWVYTQQYGWVWMPYGDAYTSVPGDGYGQPYMYVYYPVYGWSWVVAPWLWGWGAWPYFGAFGPSRFAWYRHGWWRNPWQWHPGPRAPANAFRGVRPAPNRFGAHAYPGARPAPRVGGFAPRGGAYLGRSAPAPGAAITSRPFTSRGSIGGGGFGGHVGGSVGRAGGGGFHGGGGRGGHR